MRAVPVKVDFELTQKQFSTGHLIEIKLIILISSFLEDHSVVQYPFIYAVKDKII